MSTTKLYQVQLVCINTGAIQQILLKSTDLLGYAQMVVDDFQATRNRGLPCHPSYQPIIVEL